MDEKIIAAIIGATAAILGIVLRDFLIKNFEFNRDQKLTASKVFRKYTDPLVLASEDLVWRLDEILNQAGRGSYLLNEKYQTRFAEYKRLSTIYRISALLGWIRAYRREISFLRSPDETQVLEIRNSIRDLEKALADGAHVEMKRLDALLDLWKSKFNSEYDDKPKVAVLIDHELKNFLQKENCKTAVELPTEKQLLLSRSISDLLCSNFGIMNKLSDQILQETLGRAMEFLSLKEAWIYKDWQSAIGDMMLKESPSEERQFEVQGYYEFEKSILQGDEIGEVWFERLNALIYNLDASGTDKSDIRISQLHQTMVATAKLLKAIIEKDPQQIQSRTKTIELIDKITSNEKAANK